MAALAALVVLVRLPFVFNAGVDEAFYLVVGRQWLEGVMPYAGSFDVKPPLLFALMAAAEAVLGPSLIAAKVLSMVAVAATSCGLYHFGRRFVGEFAGISAALLYMVSTLALGGAFSQAELLMAPFTTFGMLIGLPAALDKARVRVPELVFAGLCFGAAACIKHTAIFEAIPLALVMLFGRSPSKTMRALGSFSLGFCITPSGFAILFLAAGHFDALIADVIVAAAGRMNAVYIPWSEALERVLIEFLLALPVTIMAGLLWLNRRPWRVHPGSAALKFVAAWTGAALLGAVAGRAMLIFYFLPVLQPLCIAAGAFMQRGLGNIPNRKRQWIAGSSLLAIVVLYSGCWVEPLFFAGYSGVRAAEAAANLMRHSGQRKGDRILVTDRDMIVYLATGAEPPTPVFHPIQLLCNFPFAAAASALADSLDRHPAFVVVGEPSLHLQCQIADRLTLLQARLARDYDFLRSFQSTVTGSPGSFAVYRLKDRLQTNVYTDLY